MDIWIWGYVDIWIFNESFNFRQCVVQISEKSSNVCHLFVLMS